jgi:hypothetical protein
MSRVMDALGAHPDYFLCANQSKDGQHQAYNRVMDALS